MVDTATIVFCMVKFSEIYIARRGLRKGYVDIHNEKKLDKFSFVWVDIYQRYLIYNTSSLKPGMQYERERLKQLDDITNVDIVRVKFEINQPGVAEKYYSINSDIDKRNGTIQDDFQFKSKLQTKDWSIRVNTSILVEMMLITIILVRLVSGGMAVNLQISTTILHMIWLTTGGLKEGHEEIRQENL